MRGLFVKCSAMALVAVSLLTACGGQSGQGSAETGTEQTAAPVQTAAGQSAESTVSGAEPMKVVFLLPGLLGDKSFMDATDNAARLIQSELGIETKVIEMGTDQTRWYSTFVDYCEEDYDLICTVTASVNDVLIEVCDEYPDLKFMNLACAAAFERIPENLYVMAVKQNEMGYIAGVVAGLKAQEAGEEQIGFIGGMDTPDLNEFLLGYIEGSRSIEPDMKVAYSWVGAFNDPGKGKENALVLYKDCSVVYHAAGATGLGVFDAAKEMTAKGKTCYAIGVDSDQAAELKESSPEAAKLIITSTRKLIPEMTLDAMQKLQAGEIQFGQQVFNGMAEHAVALAKNEFYDELMSEEQKQLITEIEDKIAANEITPIWVRGMSSDDIGAYRDAARP